MIDFSPKLVLQVMDDRAGRRNRRRHFAATKAIKRLGFEVFAEGEDRLLRQKGVAVVLQALSQVLQLVRLGVANQQFRGRDPGQLIQ